MTEDMRPPINRAMRTLDRSFFKKTVPISAARIFQNQHISKVRGELNKSRDILDLERISTVRSDPDGDLAQQGRKCLLLKPDIKASEQSTWSAQLKKLAEEQQLSVIPFTLELDYEYWTYHDIMSAILPEDSLHDLPSGFSIVGHIAHLNIRDQYLQYKELMATVLKDKNPMIRTVINKIDMVGEESPYRTFSYEVLAGPDDLNVVHKEQGCTFVFDYAKVYWNSRLQTEHERLVDLFQEGEAVCDVMAGIGPFALPAGKKHCFVWANDLNPESYAALNDGISRNKVQQFVRPFSEDGHIFIPHAVKNLYRVDNAAVVKKKQPRVANQRQTFIDERIPQPKTFSHFVMNLPASALTFLPSFTGVYAQAGIPKGTKLPKIHVYCFNTKSDDNKAETDKICETISDLLNYGFKPGSSDVEGEIEVFDVRDVAPKKRMFCASFILPEDVAHRTS